MIVTITLTFFGSGTQSYIQVKLKKNFKIIALEIKYTTASIFIIKYFLHFQDQIFEPFDNKLSQFYLDLKSRATLVEGVKAPD